MARPRPRFTALLVAAALACVVTVDALVPDVSAQDDPATTTTTAVPVTEPPSTTVAPAPESTTTVAPDATTTTVPYVPTIPPELIGDPRVPYLVDPGESGTIDIDIAQNSFDPLSVQVLPERVEAAKFAVFLANLALMGIQGEIVGQTQMVAELTQRLDLLDADSRKAVDEAAEAKRRLIEHAVTAYMTGPVDDRLALLSSHDFQDMGIARSYVEVVVDAHERLTKRYETKRDALSDEHAALASELGDPQGRLVEIAAREKPAFEELLKRLEEQRAYEAGAHAYIDGFVFPIAGDCEFIDSWGYPRSGGRWHQGADIFALRGTPVVASENGVLDGVGSGTLGGIKLWVNGDSGNEYYYAHLAGFAPGVANGKRVRAGEVVGFVGDTGNAVGTSPHLHFEIHPNGAGPANPYPLLKAAYGNRPVVRATVPTTTTTTVAPAVPVEPGVPVAPVDGSVPVEAVPPGN